jgi:hypothetical protein
VERRAYTSIRIKCKATFDQHDTTSRQKKYVPEKFVDTINLILPKAASGNSSIPTRTDKGSACAEPNYQSAKTTVVIFEVNSNAIEKYR